MSTSSQAVSTSKEVTSTFQEATSSAPAPSPTGLSFVPRLGDFALKGYQSSPLRCAPAPCRARRGGDVLGAHVRHETAVAAEVLRLDPVAAPAGVRAGTADRPAAKRSLLTLAKVLLMPPPVGPLPLAVDPAKVPVLPLVIEFVRANGIRSTWWSCRRSGGIRSPRELIARTLSKPR
ncbi:hypothetical protein GGTG_11021 [Gaeumannomyces tritici R3-111a-1]|uniref:Uncharacterized protein n=1 Tax=Gaeumannomyces tritici (strain R3-111a-1) TaxID=644352 RepID=J3PBZ7_GAET3|nr:hypothetical protein GGTG_11021 [Gaeumannomyces tritici R3-111a-1]EJT71767.1 hypothetical protein GGTG_11021 [Gaeumannomyces tritici R3-111a-1]